MLSEQVIMIPSIKNRWRAMREDARETLESAFISAITNPRLVSRYFCHTKHISGYIVEFHYFRVGYAGFIIAIVDDFPAILLDVELEDGLPLYPL